MVNSMTGYATCSGDASSARWIWEIRAVNGKGYDLRMRLPEGCDALEKAIKTAVQAKCSRGSITVSLKVQTDDAEGVAELNDAALASVITAVKKVQTRSAADGISLRKSSAAEILSLRSVLVLANSQSDNKDWQAAAQAQIPELVNSFCEDRAREGAALKSVLADQVANLKTLSDSAATQAEARKEGQAQKLKERVAALLSNKDDLDETRLEQELAILAVKADITEELDRLGAHIEAAADLLEQSGPIGRKFDFLMQEFNRETNTLCSKSGSTALTTIGLELKTTIDQMREQVQNIE